MGKFLILLVLLAVVQPAFAGEGNKEAFIDKTGKIIVPIRPETTMVFPQKFQLGLAAMQQGSLYGYIDRSGNIAIKPSFLKAFPFNEQLAAVKDKTNKWGYIDKTGAYKIKPRFDSALSFENGYAIVSKNRKSNFINKHGKILSKTYFDHCGCFSEEGLAPIALADKWGYLNKKGQIEIPFDVPPFFRSNQKKR